MIIIFKAQSEGLNKIMAVTGRKKIEKFFKKTNRKRSSLKRSEKFNQESISAHNAKGKKKYKKNAVRHRIN